METLKEASELVKIEMELQDEEGKGPDARRYDVEFANKLFSDGLELSPYIIFRLERKRI